MVEVVQVWQKFIKGCVARRFPDDILNCELKAMGKTMDAHKRGSHLSDSSDNTIMSSHHNCSTICSLGNQLVGNVAKYDVQPARGSLLQTVFLCPQHLP